MVKVKAAIGALAIATGLTISNPAAAEWKWYLIEKQASDSDLRQAETWINNSCRPDRFQDVTGIFSQSGGAGSDYNIYIFCREGTGKAEKVKIAKYPWPSNASVFASTYMRKDFSILGFYDGKETDVVLALITD